MAFFTKKAGPAQAAVDRQTIISCILGFVILLAPVLSHAQAAAYTSISQISGTDTFDLVFTQPSPPLTLAGVEFYVVVEGNDPKISLLVPGNSWMLDQDATDLQIGNPSVEDEVYRFPIAAWRNDNTPQSGAGLYLQVVATDGIVIAIEDFPTKQVVAFSSIVQEMAESPSNGGLQTTEVQVMDLQGRQFFSLQGNELSVEFADRWENLPHGVYLVAATLSNQTRKTWKALR